jgi:transglutaminase-like putative cysteine protease
MIYQIRHTTRVRYDAFVRLARFNLRLRPADWPNQTIEDYQLIVKPAPASIQERRGAYPVNIARLVIESPLRELEVESRFRATVSAEAAEPMPEDPTVAEVAEAALEVESIDPTAPANYLFASPRAPMVAEIGRWGRAELVGGRGIVEAGLALCQFLKEEFTYDPAATEASTPAEEAFAARHGVCQDFAHVMAIALRMAGLPAAYVSGYLRTDPPPGRPRLIGADATHAWVMLWCGPQRGWIGFDPTNGVITGSGHIFTAMGRDISDVAPMDGIFVGQADQDVQVEVDVMPIEEVAEPA